MSQLRGSPHLDLAGCARLESVTLFVSPRAVTRMSQAVTGPCSVRVGGEANGPGHPAQQTRLSREPPAVCPMHAPPGQPAPSPQARSAHTGRGSHPPLACSMRTGMPPACSGCCLGRDNADACSAGEAPPELRVRVWAGRRLSTTTANAVYWPACKQHTEPIDSCHASLVIRDHLRCIQ
jgi:hypothetical protein